MSDVPCSLDPYDSRFRAAHASFAAQHYDRAANQYKMAALFVPQGGQQYAEASRYGGLALGRAALEQDDFGKLQEAGALGQAAYDVHNRPYPTRSEALGQDCVAVGGLALQTAIFSELRGKPYTADAAKSLAVLAQAQELGVVMHMPGRRYHMNTLALQALHVTLYGSRKDGTPLAWRSMGYPERNVGARFGALWKGLGVLALGMLRPDREGSWRTFALRRAVALMGGSRVVRRLRQLRLQMAWTDSESTTPRHVQPF